MSAPTPPSASSPQLPIAYNTSNQTHVLHMSPNRTASGYSGAIRAEIVPKSRFLDGGQSSSYADEVHWSLLPASVAHPLAARMQMFSSCGLQCEARSIVRPLRKLPYDSYSCDPRIVNSCVEEVPECVIAPVLCV